MHVNIYLRAAASVFVTFQQDFCHPDFSYSVSLLNKELLFFYDENTS
jgi:hypothetical protein